FLSFLFHSYVDHPSLSSFPTRLSSDLQRLFHSKFFSHKSSLGDFLIFRLFRGDKLSLPVLRGSEPCDKYRSLTPGTLLPVSVPRSEEHTSELQSRFDLVCRLLLETIKS